MKPPLTGRIWLQIEYFCLFSLFLLVLMGCRPEQPIAQPTSLAPSLQNSSPEDNQPEFTPEEKAWLAEHPIIRMGVEENFPPYEFLDEQGAFTGISADYRAIISSKLGIQLEVQQYSDFSRVRAAIQRKDLDLVLLLTPTADRKEFLLFTQPFFDYQLVLVTRDDYPAVNGLEDFNGKTLAVVRGYASAEYISKNYPLLDIVANATVEDGLVAVSTGKVDAFANEVFATVYHIRNKSINNLKIAASIPSDLPGYAIGVRDDWPELVTILDKALATITVEEKLQVSEKWLSVKYEQGFDYSLFWKILAGGFFILGIFVYWNRRLAKEVALRIKTEDALRESEKNYRLLFERSASAIAVHEKINDADGQTRGYRFLDVNPVFEQLTGLRRDQVVGQDALAAMPGYDKFWLDLYGEVEAGRERAPFEQYYAPLDRYYQGIAYSPQPGRYAVSFMDITTRKRIEDELRKYQQHLEELVAERTTDLETKNISLAAEITERKRAQQELEDSEANFRAMAENASDAILIAAGDNGQYVFANRRAEELSGYEAAELYELGILGLVQPDDRQKLVELYKLRIRGEPSPVRFETVYLHKTGMMIPVEITATQIHWHGEPASMAIVRDISERKKREAEIIQQNYELEIIAGVSATIREIERPADLADLILEKSISLLEMDRGFLALLESGHLLLSSGRNLPASIDHLPGSFERFLISCMSSDGPQFISATSEGIAPPSLIGTPWEPLKEDRSWVFIPLKSFESTIGILAISGREFRESSPQDRRLVAGIVNVAGNALDRLRTMSTLEEKVAGRTRDLAALNQVMSVVNQPDKLEQILKQSLDIALLAVNCSAGCIHLAGAGGAAVILHPEKPGSTIQVLSDFWDGLAGTLLAEEILTRKKPALVSGVNDDSRIGLTALPGLTGELIGVPLLAGGTVRGALWGLNQRGEGLTPEDIALLVSIGERIATTIENFQLRERTQQVAILEERQRLARDLHDSVTQQIYSLLLMAGGAKKTLSRDELENTGQLIKRIEEISRQALKELRLLIFELRPLDLQQVGLAEALQQRLESVEQRAGIHVHLLTQLDSKIPYEAEEELYRIAIEALNNSLKHAEASDILVRLCSSAGNVELEIKDNGKGFVVGKEKNSGSGLLNMQERARKIGAMLQITSNPGTGTSISAIREDEP